MKVIVSFTTSPCRIHKTKIMVESILNQSRKPDYFLLNIPKIFPRTGKSYDIPDFIKDNDDITVNVLDKDFGPATKVIPTIQFIKDNNINISETRIIYVDDDIKQLPDMISTFLKYSKSENLILGTSGFDFKTCFPNRNRIIMEGKREHLRIVNVIEGYGAVCLSPKVFKSDFIEYFNYYSNFKYCLLSDDVILSNYYNKYDNQCIIVNTPLLNLYKLYKEKCILEYGNLEDALHINNGNLKKYLLTISHLKRDNKLYLNIKSKKRMKMQFFLP